MIMITDPFGREDGFQEDSTLEDSTLEDEIINAITADLIAHALTEGTVRAGVTAEDLHEMEASLATLYPDSQPSCLMPYFGVLFYLNKITGSAFRMAIGDRELVEAMFTDLVELSDDREGTLRYFESHGVRLS